MGVRNQFQGPNSSRPAIRLVGAQGAHKSTFSTAPWENPRKGRCSANGNTCKAYAKKGSNPPLCAGHGRSDEAKDDSE